VSCIGISIFQISAIYVQHNNLVPCQLPYRAVFLLIEGFGNSLDKLRHPRSDSYSAEQATDLVCSISSISNVSSERRSKRPRCSAHNTSCRVKNL